jgi:hypothetical protein
VRFIESPFIAPHWPARDWPEPVAPAGDDDGQLAPGSRAEQEPPRLGMRRLDDAPAEGHVSAEQARHVGARDAVLAELRFVGGASQSTRSGSSWSIVRSQTAISASASSFIRWLPCIHRLDIDQPMNCGGCHPSKPGGPP